MNLYDLEQLALGRQMELVAAVDPFSGFDKLVDCLQVEPDDKPGHG